MTGYNELKGAGQILVVEDDPVQRRLLKNAIERHGHVVHQAENGRIGLEMVKRDSGLFNVIVLDLMMPEMTGLEFLDALHEFGTQIPVIVQTGQGGIETVVQAMRAGAFDFVVKPVSPERIATSISNAMKLDQREVKARAGRRSRSGSVGFDDIVSASPAMLRVIDLAQRAAQSNIPVVLEGESGVGKELVRAPSSPAATARTSPSSQSIAGRSRIIWSKAFSSVTRRARLPARPSVISANSWKPTAAPSSSTRSAICRSRCR